ncbi:MAG: apolipoprotein N-acyltransferase [Candidatus Omnitrophica bacterium]|nr:apolipoprotein N-acyltransferase [Candidatus Omnitrophota bacterium]
MLRKIDILLAVSSSILLSFSFSTLNLSFLAWIGLVPLFFALQGLRPKQAFIISYLCGFLFFLSSMYWLIHVTLFGWIILSLYQALYFGLFGFFYCLVIPAQARIHKIKFTPYVFLPALWVLLEYLRANFCGGIGWNLLGYSQYENIPIIQIADITGVYGITFLVVLVNFSVFSVIKMAIRCQGVHKRLFARSQFSLKEEIAQNPLFQTAAVFLVVVCVLLYGQRRVDALDKESASLGDVKISVIQGNIEQPYKWDKAYKNSIMEAYKNLTIKVAQEKPGLIIWPETSLPGYPDRDRGLMRYIKDLAREVNIPILVGAPMVAVKSGEDVGDYNSALLFSGKGRLLDQYNKLHLVMFGEFIPLGRYFPLLRRILPVIGNFIPGDKYKVFKLATNDYRPQPMADPPPAEATKFSTLICFEDIFPVLSRQFVKNGADFIVNITNDAWFGPTSAAYQHAANSVFRAVENRRPFIRSANTGLSCFIDRIGRIYSKVSSNGNDLFIRGYDTASLALLTNSALTFYTRFGDIFVVLCFILSLLFIIDYIRSHRYNN